MNQYDRIRIQENRNYGLLGGMLVCFLRFSMRGWELDRACHYYERT